MAAIRTPAVSSAARCLGLAMLAWPSAALATFSIAACDPAGNCGVAVATNNLAVGASVPYAQARVGALVSQFETNPAYGPRGLALMAAGSSPEHTIKALLDADGDFDGQTIAARQIGVVDAKGRASAYTGAEAQDSAWAGAVQGDGYSLQGNGLAGPQVLAAMQRAFDASDGALAERLMRALEAGESAGGQSTGRMSAALLVKTVEGGWQDVDLRVDGAAEPVRDLRRLTDQHHALQAIARAERDVRAGRKADARAAIKTALALSHRWDRIWRRAARLAMTMGDNDSALEYLGVLRTVNPPWALMEIEDQLYRPLHANPLFASWRKK